MQEGRDARGLLHNIVQGRHAPRRKTQRPRAWLYVALTLFSLAGLVGAYVHRLGTRRALGGWSSLAGLAFGLFWITREEGLWLLPAFAGLLGLAAWSCLRAEGRRALPRLFGWEPHELIGRSALELIAPEARSEVAPRLVSEEGQPFEALGRRRDGGVFPIEVHQRRVTSQGESASPACTRFTQGRSASRLASRESRTAAST